MSDKIISSLFTLGFVACFLFLGYVVEESIRSNGETDYCFIHMYSPPDMAPQWMLRAHRPWREDRSLGAYSSMEEAKSKADTMGCKLNAR